VRGSPWASPSAGSITPWPVNVVNPRVHVRSCCYFFKMNFYSITGRGCVALLIHRYPIFEPPKSKNVVVCSSRYDDDFHGQIILIGIVVCLEGGDNMPHPRHHAIDRMSQHHPPPPPGRHHTTDVVNRKKHATIVDTSEGHVTLTIV
jgi:hypothetical protein